MTRFLDPVELFPAGSAGISARFLTLRSGLRVRVVESGPRDAPPVLLVPGWGGSVYLYRKNLPALANAGLRTIAVDLKGQGLSDKPLDPREYTLDSLAAHVLDVLDALALPDVILVGLSLGGGIATRVALQAPDRVRKLALLNPVGFGRVRLIRAARFIPSMIPAFMLRFAGRPTIGLVLRAAYGTLAAPTRRDMEEYLAPACDPAFARSLWLFLRAANWDLVTANDVARLRMPLLLLRGDRDRFIAPAGVESLLCHAPDVRTIVIPGAGHILAEETPEEVNRALIEFLIGPRSASQP